MMYMGALDPLPEQEYFYPIEMDSKICNKLKQYSFSTDTTK